MFGAAVCTIDYKDDNHNIYMLIDAIAGQWTPPLS